MVERETYRKNFEYPYSHSITLRKSGMPKKSWEYIVRKFGIASIEPEKILSITLSGEDDYGRLQMSIVAVK